MQLEAILRRIDLRMAQINEGREKRDRLTDAKIGKLANKTDAVRNLRRAAKDNLRQGTTIDTIFAIAHVLQTSASWILEGFGSPESRQVPLVSWVSAGSLAQPEVPVEDLAHLPMIQAPDLPDGEWIALRVVGDSMDRISPPESVIFVNRRDKRLIPNGCYVIAGEDGEATYKRFRPDPMRFEPVSINTEHEAIFPDAEPIIIGRVRKTMLDM